MEEMGRVANEVVNGLVDLLRGNGMIIVQRTDKVAC
jgi:hypothetical protein